MICKCGATVEPAYHFDGRCEDCYALDMNRIPSDSHSEGHSLARRFDYITQLRRKSLSDSGARRAVPSPATRS